MLSYRHGFHAGNHADVLKHLTELALIDYLSLKGKPFWYIDTHAGAGVYALTEGFAAKNAEYAGGIARLWDETDAPEAVTRYVDLVRRLNTDGVLRHYPGSPWVAAEAMAGTDKLRLFELHPSDAPLLAGNFDDQKRRVQVQQADGFEAIKSLLPPPPRRALTLIDPPYEDKRDYQRVASALKDALRRFATGVYAVWYPCLARREVGDMVDALKKLPAKNWLNVRLDVATPAADGFGMYGSGMFILNAPWTLPATLAEVMPYLAGKLALDAGARYVIEQGGDL